MKKYLAVTSLALAMCFSITTFAETQSVCSSGTPDSKYKFSYSATEGELNYTSEYKGSVSAGSFEVENSYPSTVSDMESAAVYMLRKPNRKIISGTTYSIKNTDTARMGNYPNVAIFKVSDGSTVVEFFFKINSALDSKYCRR